MATERNVVDFKIHNLTEEQFQELKAQGKIDPNAVYCTPDESLKVNQITNCITEIPQDKKLELNNGVLTLKAGAKVYVPNGAGVFNEITITRDLTASAASTGKTLICANSNGSGLIARVLAKSVSGTTRPLTEPYMLWYDTTNNVINNYGSDSSTPALTVSLPIAVVTVSNGAISSIDQVFNGFGYIGGTIFTLPGIKGLVPNGRNADGTLNNVNVFNATTVKINTPSDGEYDICLSRFSGYTDVTYVGTYIYDSEDNFVKRSSNGLVGGYILAGKFTKTGGRITDFYVRPAFHAVDYSDFESTVEEINSSISAVDSSAVHKTGNETIADTKTFTGRIILESNDNEIKITNPNNSAFDGFVRATSTGFAVGTQKDGNWKKTIVFTDTTITAATPASTSNSTEVATTAWVNTAAVHKAGDETIGGDKTFTGNVEISGQTLIFTGLPISTNKDIDAYGYKTTGGTETLIGSVRFENSGAANSVRLVSRKLDGSEGATLSAITANDGSTRTIAVTPNNSSNSVDIATTAFVKSVLANNDVGLAVFSKTQNGYYKFSNGLIIQWGRIAAEAASTNGSVTFPTPFTRANASVQIEFMSASNAKVVRATNITTTGFSYATDTFGSANPTAEKTWIAIGY